MKPRRKPTAAPRSPSETNRAVAKSWSVVSVAFVVLAAVYLIAYFRVDVGPLGAQGLTRGALWEYLLLPDVLVQHWLGDDGEFALFDRGPILAGAALFHLAAFGVGTLALRMLRWRRGDKLEGCLIAHGVGLGIVSLITLGVGLAGGLQTRWWLLGPWSVAALAAITLYLRAPRLAQNKSPTVDTNDWLSPYWLLLAVPFVAFVTLGGALPPIEFDVREYHLQAPKEFYQLGRIEFLPHNVYANMPLGAEMWTLAAMSITSDWWLGALIGKTVIATLLPFTAAALYVVGKRLGSRTAGIVAAIVYLSFPWMLQVAMFGLIEGAVAFYVALALLVLLGDVEGESVDAGACLLAGFFAGSAAACKYPALLFVVAPVVALMGWRSRIAGVRAGTRNAALGLLSAAICIAPWLIKNWYFTGNPTYPLFYSLFDGATRTAENAAQWREAHRPHGFGLDFLAQDARRILLGSPWLSPIVWPLIAGAIAWGWRENRPASGRRAMKVLALYVAFILLCWWLFTHRIDRFWLPAVPGLALLAGWGASMAGDRLARGGVIGLLVLGSVWSFLWAGLPLAGLNRYFAPLAQLRLSPERVDPWILELNQRGGRVLSIGEAAVFDFDVPVLYNTTFDPSWLERYGVDDAESPDSLAAFDQLVADHQIDYLYVDWDEIRRYRTPGNYGFDPRVTEGIFWQLVRADRLSPPLPRKDHHAGSVYPIRPSRK